MSTTTIPVTLAAPVAPEVPVFLTAAETAQTFRVALRTLQRWAAEGKIPARRMPGGDLRFALEDVIAFGAPTSA